jgi:hypothetical protein
VIAVEECSRLLALLPADAETDRRYRDIVVQKVVYRHSDEAAAKALGTSRATVGRRWADICKIWKQHLKALDSTERTVVVRLLGETLLQLLEQ